MASLADVGERGPVRRESIEVVLAEQDILPRAVMALFCWQLIDYLVPFGGCPTLLLHIAIAHFVLPFGFHHVHALRGGYQEVRVVGGQQSVGAHIGDGGEPVACLADFQPSLHLAVVVDKLHECPFQPSAVAREGGARVDGLLQF